MKKLMPYNKWKVSTVILVTLLIVLAPITVIVGQNLLTVREVLNKVYDRDNVRLMVDPWSGPSAQTAFLTEVEIFNKVFDTANNRLITSGGGGGGSSNWADLISGTNSGGTFVLGNGSSLDPSGTGTITATGASTNPGNCSAGLLAAGVDAAFIAEGCVDVATQTELNTHEALTSPHSASSANIASRLVIRDATGNFSAGTITAALTGNVTGNVTGSAGTAAALAANPSPCGANLFATDIAADGTITCTQPAFSNLTGAATDAQVPNLNTLSTGLTVSRCVETDGTGALVSTSGLCGSGGGGGAFDTLTSGTNTTATMIVGNGASLAASGSGTITATSSTVATALSVDPSACIANGFVTDIAANGTLTCTQPAFSNLSGAATDAQIPNLNTLGTGLTVSRCVETDGTGALTVAAGVCGTPGGGAQFDALTSGMNTTAAMVVGTGASLGISGSGTITATAASTNPGNCSAGLLAAGVDAAFVAEGCTDVATQTELNTHEALTAPHSATALNTASRIVLRDASGNFAAGTITAALTGNASTATAASANPGNCGAGLLAAGVDAGWAAEGCVDVATQTELDTHINGTSVHSATAANTASRIVLRDASGNFVAGTITAALTGNASTATTAAALTANGSNCTAPDAATGVSASGVAEGCFTVVTPTGVQTLTNKHVQSKLLDQADTSPIAVDCSLYNVVRIDELSQATTFNAPTGCTPTEDQSLVFMIFTTTARALTFGTGGNAFGADYGVALPTTSYAGSWVKYGFHWNSIVAKWVFDASSQTTTYGTAGHVLTSNGAGVEPTFQASAGGGGGTGTIHLPVSAVSFPTSGDTPAQLDGAEVNKRLLFDQTTKWCAYWGPFDLNTDYVGTPVFKLKYSMTSATTNGVVFGIYVMAYTSGDTADAVTESFDTVNNCIDTAVPSVAGRAEEISCSLTAVDSIAANDLVKIKICREVAHASDTSAGVAEVLTSKLEYAK